MTSLSTLAVLCSLHASPVGPQVTPGLPFRPVPRMRRAEPSLEQPLSGPQFLSSAAMRSDAGLADVCFINARQGWAVGDRGTIWHTENGGRQWHLQRSGVTCPLRSVWFVDQSMGWAAGGFSHPYTHTSSGVLLTTHDGGRSWQPTPRLMLPALHKVRFFDSENGWAIGCPSAMFPTGLFVTDCGGRGWRPVAGQRLAPWLAGDLLDANTGALAGRGGTVATVQRGGIRPSPMGSFGLRNLTGLQLVAPVHGWLIGDGGLIMITADAGASWQTPPGELPPATDRLFDFAALAVRGPRCWVAGSPGTRVFHSPDAGRTWQAFGTGTRLPISGLCFVDDQQGWAVGALGTILATRDGGQTWQRQRAGGTRAALLGVFSDGPVVPLELFAGLCGNEGYLGVVEVLNRRDVEVRPHGETHPDARIHEAVVAVGGNGANTAWRFPLRQPGLRLGAQQIVEGWDRANDSRGLLEIQAHLVRQIRLWRPEVLVTHDASPRGDDPLGHLINQLVLRAIEQAGDAACLPEQITLAGLEPWKVKKVYAALPEGGRGAAEVTTAKLAARLGCSLADAAAVPRGLLVDRFAPAPQSLGFQLLACSLPQEQGRRDFFSGIVLYPGGEARRELTDPPPENLDRLRRIAQRQRNSQAVVQQCEKDSLGGAQLLAQADELTRDLDPGSAGRVLYHLGQRYCQTGRWPMAAETFELLIDRHPAHPLTPPALLWLVQYYAGSEPEWRVHGGQRVAIKQASVSATDAAGQPSRADRTRYAVRQASALAAPTPDRENRPDRAAQLGKQIEQNDPQLFAEEALRFPLAVAHRNQGFPREAERFYMMQSRNATHDAWWACARGEQWLAKPLGLPPKPVLRCVRARTKPRLDGRLDDAVWQQAKPAELRSAQHDDGQWPAAVMLAYDAEHLYLAIKCRQAPGAEYMTTQGPRPRDPDLAAQDRVDVLLDLDRDFATYYRLTVDHRGWPAESCWGDHTWNPTWFVAADTSQRAWTVEAAVPLEQLTGRYPSSRDVWAIGLQRIVPGVGFQSWNAPASTGVIPEGFGYLIFD